MTPATIRCPDCGRRVASTEPTCGGCRSALLQLCECGATSHMSARACGACGAELQAPEYVRRPMALRIVAAVVLVALVATAGWAAWNASQRRERKSEIWRLSDEAFAAVKAGRFAEALPILERYTAERPRDAQMLYLLAVTERELDARPLAGVEAAQAALDVNPSFSEAAAFLAAAFDASGDVERALHFVRTAISGSNPRADEFRLLASLELRRERPDLDAAIAALRRAEDLVLDDEQDPRLVALIALLQMRRFGSVPMSALPADVLGDVARAEEIVLAAAGDLADDPLIRLVELEIAVAHRRPAPARRLAERLVADASAPEDVALRARVLLGGAALAEGDFGAARAAFDDALRRAPTRATAADVALACSAAGSLDLAADLISDALHRDGADPGIREVLSSLQAARGDLRAAADGLRAAAAERPGDAALLVQFGDVLARLDEPEAADEAYAAAEECAGSADPVPGVRRALLDVSRRTGARDRRAAAASAVDRLDARLGPPSAWTHAAALEARGRLAALAGRAEDARRVLTRALVLAPQDAHVRVSLAEAVLGEAGDDAGERASGLLREAADLAPFDERCVVRVARLAMAMGDPQHAHAVCRRFTDRMGPTPAVLEVSAAALRRLGRWSDAAASLESLRTAAADDSGEVLRLLVDSLLRAGAAGEARRFVVEADPEGRDERLQLLLALHGATPQERLARLRERGDSVELGFALLAEGDVDGALDALRGTVALRPDDFVARRALVLLLLEGRGLSAGPDTAALAEASALAEGLPDGAAAGERDALRAAVALGSGHVGDARELLESAIGALPDDPYVNVLLGRALFESGERAEALGPLRRAVSLPGALPGFPLVLSRCLHAVAADAGSEDARERLLWEALLHDPQNAGATVDLVNLLFESRRDTTAARLARRLLEMTSARPDLVPADVARGLRRLVVAATLRATGLRGLIPAVDEFPFDDEQAADRLMDGLLLLRAGRDADALTLFAEVLVRHPGSPIASIAAIEAHVRRGMLADARAVAEAAERSSGRTSRFRVALAAALLRAERPREALEETAGAAAADAADEDVVEVRARAALRLEDVPAALASIAAAEAAADGAARTRLALLRCAVLREHGSADASLRVARGLREAASHDPVLAARVRLAEAEALLRLHRFDELAALEPDLALAPGDSGPTATRAAARVAFVRGTLAMTEGRLGDAIGWLRESLRLDASEPAAANNLAWLYAQRPSWASDGLELSRSATAAAPRNPEFWDTRATCARTLGRVEEAETSWRTALELLGPESRPPGALRVELWTGLAELLAEVGRFDEAIGLARRVLDAPTTPELRRRAHAVLRLR